MRLIDDNTGNGIDRDGHISFELNGYHYHVGKLEDVHWISRQTMDDFQNGRDNWERVQKWIPENQRDFNFFRDKEEN